MHIDNKKHKIKGNKIFYLNGDKWLVRQSFDNEDDAIKTFAELKVKRNLKEDIEKEPTKKDITDEIKKIKERK
jgi:hypothetical protein